MGGGGDHTFVCLRRQKIIESVLIMGAVQFINKNGELRHRT